MKEHLDIFIVAYQRPMVLLETLERLLINLGSSEVLDVHIYCWVNKATQQDREVKIFVSQFSPKIRFYLMEENHGKAYALNTLYDLHGGRDHYIMVLDQDMVFNMPFMHILENAIKLRFDILGFASTRFWAHIPPKDEVSSFDWGWYRIYYTTFIAGGIMLCNKGFLEGKRWTNEDGIYGGDDFNMCRLTESKFILEWNEDWLVHDPLGPQSPELADYYKKKRYYLDQGLYVLPHGWYENELPTDN